MVEVAQVYRLRYSLEQWTAVALYCQWNPSSSG